MRANSRSSARGFLAGRMLAVPLPLLAITVARASAVSPDLASGTYPAIASQESSIGSRTGVSNPVTFEVDTQSPTVTLTSPPSRSNVTTPSFSGTASEASPVTVEIFEGARPGGDIVATATASGTRGGWSSGNTAPALP